MSTAGSKPAKKDAPTAEAGGRTPLGRQLHIVASLARKAVAIVSGIWRDAGIPAEAAIRPALDWLARVHPRIARAMRMAVLLQARLKAEAKKQLRVEAEHAVDLPRVARLPSLGDLLRGLEPDRAYADPLRRYVASHPVEALIEEIRRDLGVAPAWLRQVEEEWERLQPASPSPDVPVAMKAPGGPAASGQEDRARHSPCRPPPGLPPRRKHRPPKRGRRRRKR